MASHYPVLQTAIELFGSGCCLELGCGLFSTPLLWEGKFDSVESWDQDEEWTSKVKRQNPPEHCVVTHFTNPSGLKTKNRFNELASIHVWLNGKFALEQSKAYGHPDFLFVDGAANMRFFMLDVFLPVTSTFAAWHDTEDGKGTYGYNYLTMPKDSLHFRHSSYPANTDYLLIGDARDLKGEFIELLEKNFNSIPQPPSCPKPNFKVNELP